MWLLLSVVLATDPPLVPAPAVEPVTTLETPRLRPITLRKKGPLPPPPATLALYFAPLSLFGLALWAEGDLHLGGGVSLFVNLGGGALGQVGADAGFRYYVGGKPFESFYLDVHGSVFSVPRINLLMAGPGVQLGHGWRFGRFALSIGVGFTTWYSLLPLNTAALGSSPLGITPTRDDVILLPGFATVPPRDHPGVQPTVRLSLGPTF